MKYGVQRDSASTLYASQRHRRDIVKHLFSDCRPVSYRRPSTGFGMAPGISHGAESAPCNVVRESGRRFGLRRFMSYSGNRCRHEAEFRGYDDVGRAGMGTPACRAATCRKDSPVKPPCGSFPYTSRSCSFVSRTSVCTYGFSCAAGPASVSIIHTRKKRQATHGRVHDVLNRRCDEVPHLLVVQTILRRAPDDVLAGRAAAVAAREHRLAGTCAHIPRSARRASGGRRSGVHTFVEVLVAALVRQRRTRRLREADQRREHGAARR